MLPTLHRRHRSGGCCPLEAKADFRPPYLAQLRRPRGLHGVHVGSATSHPALDIQGCGSHAMKCVFVTVGTTSFDDLIACVSAHDSLQVSGEGEREAGGRRAGGGREAAGLPALSSPLAAASLTVNLGNLA